MSAGKSDVLTVRLILFRAWNVGGERDEGGGKVFSGLLCLIARCCDVSQPRDDALVRSPAASSLPLCVLMDRSKFCIVFCL